MKNPREVANMVLLPLVASRVEVPMIAAGGIADGASMAAAFALGAEGVQMGTRMMASVESPVHENMKLAVVAAEETDTLTINHHNRRPVRVLRTATTASFEHNNEGDPLALLGSIMDLYVGGDMEASLAQCGQVAGRIEEVLPAGEIIRRTVEEFEAVIGALAERYLGMNATT
jgi:enoyl-[acyl-carrier protein] reductase II